MTDDWAADEDEFGEDFFASLAASPDDPVEDAGDDPVGLDGLLGDEGEFLYEAEGDGSFETDADGFDTDDGLDDPDLEADFGADHDFDGEPDDGADHDFGFGPDS
jgi:hypothetical protein